VRCCHPCEAVHSFVVARLPGRGRRFSVGAMNKTSLFTSLIVTCLAAAAPMTRANDPVKDILDREVPVLKDGTRMSMELVERAILEACARRKFKGTVVEPGTITAHWESRGHSFDVTIAYNESTYSIRYKDSERMDYNPTKNRIDDAYNEYVAGLNEHIEAGLDDALARLKKSLKPPKRVARINPRTAA